MCEQRQRFRIPKVPFRLSMNPVPSRLRRRTVVFLVLAKTLISLTLLGATDADSSGRPETISGRFEAHPSVEAAKEKLEKPIGMAASHFFFLAKPFVKRKLRQVTRPCRFINVIVQEDQVTTWCDRDDFAFGGPPKGAARPFVLDGERGRLDHDWNGERLIQEFVGEDGVRRHVYQIDGEMMLMAVSIMTPKLRDPFNYVLEYRRVGPAEMPPHPIHGIEP